eukprot:m.55491 g.55491  ORF g.55491 m.55491 type:complete len:573 (+) comp9249_c0_seq2:138-1856(+)
MCHSHVQPSTISIGRFGEFEYFTRCLASRGVLLFAVESAVLASEFHSHTAIICVLLSVLATASWSRQNTLQAAHSHVSSPNGNRIEQGGARKGVRELIPTSLPIRTIVTALSLASLGLVFTIQYQGMRTASAPMDYQEAQPEADLHADGRRNAIAEKQLQLDRRHRKQVEHMRKLTRFWARKSKRRENPVGFSDRPDFPLDAMTTAFQLTREPTKFKLEMAYAVDAKDPSQPLYSDNDVRLIMRAFHTVFGFQHMRLYSGHNALGHLIGTASCLVKLKRPAVEVAAGLLHNVYLQQWQPDLKLNAASACERRAALASVVGSQVERLVWQFVAQSGTGPWENCINVLTQLFEYKLNNNQTAEQAEALADVLGSALLPHVSICDELDEVMGGELALASNWKRRSSAHYKRVAKLAAQIEEPQLVDLVKRAERMNFAFHEPTDPPRRPYKELSPPTMSRVFATVKYSNRTLEQDSGSVTRLKLLNDIGRSDALLSRPYLHAACADGLCPEIDTSRIMCDQAVETGDLDAYIRKVQEQSQRLFSCEAEGKVNYVEMPALPPAWAHRGFCTEMCGES